MTILSSKMPKKMPAAHTAGIFADMTLDGPEIGTLVAVVDRAKNLPNRKTMGKQDPYCALRLGKEAKKTETDKRGGQTPKWDQELRFTVHESPDYYKLKCSVFNDDKKTDLIGESWIDLKEVVTPGGGQNDLWHQLHFKGKYAGDIRIELTYYDTRPKDEAILEKKREKERNRSESNASGSIYTVGGPRQLGPREVKRRPLPPGPRETSPAVRSPMPEGQLAPASASQAYQGPDPLPDHNRTWDSDLHHPAPPKSANSSPPCPSSREQYDREKRIAQDYSRPTSHAYALAGAQVHTSPDHDDYNDMPQMTEFDAQDCQPDHYYQQAQSGPQSSIASGEREERGYSAHSPSHVHETSSYSTPFTHASVPSAPTLPRSAPVSDDHLQHSQLDRFSTSPIKVDMYRDSPLKQSMSHSLFEQDFSNGLEPSDDEVLPPPPPVHRINTSNQTPQPAPYRSDQPVPAPRPLHLPFPNHFPLDMRSPLQTMERNRDANYNAANSPISPISNRKDSYQAYTKPAYTPVHTPTRGYVHGRPLSGSENTPPSLRAGYGSPATQSEEPHSYDDYGISQYIDRHETRHQHHEPGTLGRKSLSYDLPSIPHEARVYRTEPTFVKPCTVSPDPHITAARKSVSPRPPIESDERRLSGVPFGPDSYEVLNPVSSKSIPTDGEGPRQETSEQAKETTRQREVEKLRDQGPIIGNDGRVIDPSDHLPADTWAPEPERKTRKPEHVIRFKTKDPTKYGSSPAVVRPLSMFTPLHGSSPTPEAQPDGSAQSRSGRNKLQKQMPTRPLPTQPFQHPQSSPSVPIAIDASSGPEWITPRSAMSERPDLSEYPLFGNQIITHGYGGTHQALPYDSDAAPLPAKVPFHESSPPHQSYGGYGGMDALSAEMSTIDIGVAKGGRSGGRTRRAYGP